MIKTENGDVKFRGTGGEIAGDLYAILDAALEEVPLLPAHALEEFQNKIKGQKETSEEQIRLEAFAAMLSHLPKEELEALKKKAEEGQNDGNI